MHKKVIVLLLSVILLLILLNINSCRTIQFERDKVVVLESNTLRSERTQDSSYIVAMKSLQLSYIDLYSKLSIQDSLLQKAVDLVKQNEAREAAIVQTTQNFYKIDTTVVSQKDTIYKDSVVLIYPQYSQFFSDKWISYKIKARRDSSELLLKINNQIDYTIQEKPFFWKPSETHIQVKSHSPYSTITDLEHIVIKQSKSRIGLGLSVGYGVTNNFDVVGYLGISLNYNFIYLDDISKWLRLKKNTKTLLDLK